MVKVATGGEITEDPTFCEKYPTASGCQVCWSPISGDSVTIFFVFVLVFVVLYFCFGFCFCFFYGG